MEQVRHLITARKLFSGKLFPIEQVTNPENIYADIKEHVLDAWYVWYVVNQFSA